MVIELIVSCSNVHVCLSLFKGFIFVCVTSDIDISIYCSKTNALVSSCLDYCNSLQESIQSQHVQT